MFAKIVCSLCVCLFTYFADCPSCGPLRLQGKPLWSPTQRRRLTWCRMPSPSRAGGLCPTARKVRLLWAQRGPLPGTEQGGIIDFAREVTLLPLPLSFCQPALLPRPESPAPAGQHSRNGASKAESPQNDRRGWPETSSHPTTEPVHNPPVESTRISSNDALVLGEPSPRQHGCTPRKS